MKLKRYFIGQKPAAGMQVELFGEEFNHLANVMRTKIGDSVELFCGDGNNYLSQVTQINKKSATLKVLSMQKCLCEPNLQLDCYQALAKGDKLSLITQKITELGATSLCCYSSKFCDVKPSTGKLDRLELVSISAAKQCGRSSVLNISPITNISQIAKKVKNYDAFVVLYELEQNLQFKEVIKNLQNKRVQKIAILIGPEGGLDNSEIEELQNSGAIIASMGNRILRTETASIVATALFMQMLD